MPSVQSLYKELQQLASYRSPSFVRIRRGRFLRKLNQIPFMNQLWLGTTQVLIEKQKYEVKLKINAKVYSRITKLS